MTVTTLDDCTTAVISVPDSTLRPGESVIERSARRNGPPESRCKAEPIHFIPKRNRQTDPRTVTMRAAVSTTRT